MRALVSPPAVVDGHAQGVAHQVPERQIDAADGVGDHAAPGRSNMLERKRMSQIRSMLKGVFADEQLREMAHHYFASGSAAAAIALHTLVGGDLDGEAIQLSGVGMNSERVGLYSG